MISARKWIVFLLVLFIFVGMKLMYLSKAHPMGWDEAVYIGMGKYFYSGGNS